MVSALGLQTVKNNYHSMHAHDDVTVNYFYHLHTVTAKLTGDVIICMGTQYHKANQLPCGAFQQHLYS